MDYNSFDDNARVWVYQAGRVLTDAEAADIKKDAIAFVISWKAHGAPLKATAEIFYNLFLVLFVDEGDAAASGCSVDSSVRFIQDLEKRYNITLLDRMNVAFKNGSEVQMLRLPAFKEELKKGEIALDATVFNNMVTSLSEFKKGWEVSVKESWLGQFVVS